MVWYQYEVDVSVADKAPVDDETVNAILEAVNADSVTNSPGSVVVVGATDSPTLAGAGETMRGVLNRTVYALKARGYHVTGEGWRVFEDTDDYTARLGLDE